MLLSTANVHRRYRSSLQLIITLVICIIPLVSWYYHGGHLPDTVDRYLLGNPQQAVTHDVSGTRKSVCNPSDMMTKELDVEQIASDFGANYKNKKTIKFVQPATPYLEAQKQFLNEKDKAIVNSFRLSETGMTRRLENVESLWNVHNTPRSWQDHIEGLEDEGLAPLTKWAQNYIYQHQHPESCEGKRFYVLPNHWPKWGLGAIIRAVMMEISLAIMDDRILVFDAKYGPGSSLVDVNCTHKSLQCVVDDITNCGSYVTEENSVTTHTALMKNAIEREQEVPPAAMVLMIENMASIGLQPTGAFARYWWRSQMYGYIMRPRREALARMLEMRMNSTIQLGIVLRRGEPTESIMLPFPLPPSTISIHVRHGDKGSEGKLISTRDYIVAAERFIHRNPLAYRKLAFVSTEDPSVISALPNTPYINPSLSTGNTDWLWYHSDIPRVNHGPLKNLMAAGNKTEGILMHMMQLWMAMECDVFVGNRNSNWNKLIDAMRCTLMAKCKLPYLEAGYVGDWEFFP